MGLLFACGLAVGLIRLRAVNEDYGYFGVIFVENWFFASFDFNLTYVSLN